MKINNKYRITAVSLIVSLNGLLMLIYSLFKESHIETNLKAAHFILNFPILFGISLVYLSIQLLRTKRTAWLATIYLYLAYIVIVAINLIVSPNYHNKLNILNIENILLAILAIFLLIIWNKNYKVKSDVSAIKTGVITSLTILIIALIYGISGFLLLDKTDFHQEMSFFNAFHHTIDQFNVTTNKPLVAYSKRAHFFLDSLSVISGLAVVYSFLALFQPIKSRFSDQSAKKEIIKKILIEYHEESEEYFKLWPNDKHYFFNDSKTAAIAYKATKGVALCLADPVGDNKTFKYLIDTFKYECYINDWKVAFIHVGENNRSLYKELNFKLQKIGQEAILDLNEFKINVSQNKYFRNISNKFTKQSYSTEMLIAPHNPAIIKRLKDISDQWLKKPGRSERGYAMGYFDEAYLKQCDIFIARDAAGTIQAFLNLVPANFDPNQATYDLLRNSSENISNINDYLLLNFIDYLIEHNYQELNMGLCPLAGLQSSEDSDSNLINSALKIAYSNGNRFYSFDGLYRFKQKYQPNWRNKYIVYEGSVRGFAKTVAALMKAMRIN